MADAPLTLDYAHVRRRSRRRLQTIALVASAIACGVVGRLLYARLAPVVANRLEAAAAQREVDALSPRGVSADIAQRAGDDVLETDEQVRGAAKLTAAANRLLLATGGPSRNVGIVAVTRMLNAEHRERVVCVWLAPGGTFPVDAMMIVATVATPATLFPRRDDVRQASYVVPLVIYRDRFHLDTPFVDSNDGRRLVLTGLAGGVRFARELTIGADDVVRIRSIDAPSTQPAR